MSLLLGCIVCSEPVANQYAPSALCERCQEPCATCGGDVGHCSHPVRPSSHRQVWANPQLTETVGDPLLKRSAA
jgi:hypothetical protein